MGGLHAFLSLYFILSVLIRARTELIKTGRAASSSFVLAFIKYQNGKLEEGTRYAVFQRSFEEDGDYENEGFIKFTTKETQDEGDNGISTTTVVLAIVVGLLVLVIVVGGIVMWRRLHPNGEF